MRRRVAAVPHGVAVVRCRRVIVVPGRVAAPPRPVAAVRRCVTVLPGRSRCDAAE
ncbi:hypothetical protein ND808_27430 [Streptomyces sp. DR7-3]|uniref:hypothetical protein n=1 Tax=Streptomyces malaysiensis TaxID=92644 RepID=UPI002044BF27|nr:hypothetical protein [Streptomyces sp. DR7-3]MCM3809546.1 hypothetical protein [Streptomyces sp. DR7-3]